MKRILVLLPALALAACSLHDSEPATVSLKPSIANAQNSIGGPMVTAAVPYAALIGDGRPTGFVSERRYGDGFAQTIRLSGDDADNTIQIAVRTLGATLDEALPMVKPSENSIQAEMSAAFPRLAMKIIETPKRNAYGPYGLAVTSRADGSRCAYLWQWIDDPAKLQKIPGAQQVSLRVRICKPDTTLDKLAAELGNVRLGPPTSAAVAPTTASDAAVDPAPAKPAAKVVSRARTAALPRREIAMRVPDDGSPRYIVPLSDAGTGVSAPQQIAIPGAQASASAGGWQASAKSADATGNRLDLPPEAYNARRSPRSNIGTASADGALTTGSTR